MLFQGTPETLAGTEGVYFYMVFHYIPCYSKALQRPLRAPRELIFIWYSMIFHAIPRHSRDPWHRGSLLLYGIAGYSMLFQGAPEPPAGTEKVDFYMAFPDPCEHRLCRCLFHIPLYSIIFQAIPFPLRRGILGPCPGGLLEGFWSEVAL